MPNNYGDNHEDPRVRSGRSTPARSEIGPALGLPSGRLTALVQEELVIDVIPGIEGACNSTIMEIPLNIFPINERR